MHDTNIDSIRKIKQLPPPSGISQQIIRVASNADVDLGDLSSIINKSPAITARILRCANSAYFGQRAEISTVREAIIRVLGLRITSSLALALALTGSFNVKKCRSFEPTRYWFNAVTTALISQEISSVINLRNKPEPTTAYTAGLIHNIGIQTLVHIFPEQMDKLFLRTNKSLRDTLNSELGIDHHRAAAILAQSWDLPDEIVQSLTCIYCNENDIAENPLTSIVGLSAQISDFLYLNNKCDISELKFQQNLISVDQIQKVISEIEEQLEGLHEIAQLITSVGA